MFLVKTHSNITCSSVSICFPHLLQRGEHSNPLLNTICITGRLLLKPLQRKCNTFLLILSPQNLLQNNRSSELEELDSMQPFWYIFSDSGSAYQEATLYCPLGSFFQTSISLTPILLTSTLEINSISSAVKKASRRLLFHPSPSGFLRSATTSTSALSG